MTSRMLITGALLCALYFPTIALAVLINEIRIDQPGADTDEYFELAGTPGTSLDGLSYIVIGDGAGGSGVIEAAIDLNGLAIPDDGFFLAAESTFSLGGNVDLTTSLNFENSDNVTHMLVDGLLVSNGTDLDTNDDGLFDILAWNGIIDSLALVENLGSGELVYSDTTIGPDGTAVPSHVFRSPDGTGDWSIGEADTSISMDTAGSGHSNSTSVPEPSSLVLFLAGLALLLFRKTKNSHSTVRLAPSG